MSDFIVYEPHYRNRMGSFSIWWNCFKTVSRQRDLLFYLVIRDFLSEYKRSFIGLGWVFLSPVLTIASWVLINYTSILNPGRLSVPYPVYVMVSTMLWGLFTGIYQSTSNLFFESFRFGLDVKFHREVLAVKQVILHLLNFAVGLILLGAVLLYYKIHPPWKVIFCPLTLLPLILFGGGIGLLISVYSVVLPDSKKWLDFGMHFLMFVTPIIYSPDVNNPVIRTIVHYNPLSYLVGWSRTTLVGGSLQDPAMFCLSAAAALLIFLLGLRFLYLSEDRVVEMIY